MITTSSSAIRLNSFVSRPSTVPMLLYQRMSMIKSGFNCLHLVVRHFVYPKSVHIQSAKAASRIAYHASPAILSRCPPRSRSSAEPTTCRPRQTDLRGSARADLFKLCQTNGPMGQSRWKALESSRTMKVLPSTKH